MTALDRLAACPNWPAVLGIDAAVLYLGRESILLGLIAAGYLSPWHHEHKATDFLREDIDTALRIAKINGDALELPAKVRTVAAAIAYKNERAKAA